jgi:Ribbon-helix-helix protein, copG family
VKLTIEVNDELFARAQQRAKALGTSIEELIREYLVRLTDDYEFERLSKLANGDSRGWKFNREELHERC